jgi:KaiC/GvpD/RAD55 family RecA-like ATPase
MEAAQVKTYLDAGLCVLPCKMPEKMPSVSWTNFQKVLPTPDQHQINGSMGIVTGNVSGNLFVIDFDLKYDLTGNLFERFKEEIGEFLWYKIEQIAYIQKTVNNGIHIFLRCEEIEASMKLAQRPATQEELGNSPHEKVKVLIETRGEGGFIVCAPTPGYEGINKTLLTIGCITREEKEIILDVCRSFNEVFTEVKPPSSKKFTNDFKGLTPWEDYNQKESGGDFMTKHGWTYLKTVGENQHYCRAGKKGTTSGTWNESLGLFHCFTTSSQLEGDKSYTPFALFTYMECNKDFSEAARKLYSLGYGERFKPQTETNTQNKIERPEGFKLFRLTKQTSMERPKKLFGQLWAQGENAFLFAEDGAGKTILANQIGCSIATGKQIPGFQNEVEPQPVVLFDAELSDYQFNTRYPEGLPENFKRMTFAEDGQSALVKADIHFVVNQIEEAANELQSKVIILDNLAALTSMIDCTKTTDSIQLMGLLNDLKKKGFSILIIDHCRKPQKENEFKTISKHDLQGSKMKTNLVDSVFSIGKSCQGENHRYIKALKIRSYEMAYTKNAVATMYLKTEPLRLDFIGLDAEWQHVNDRSSQINKMSCEGKSQADIAREFGISQQAVSKLINH